MTRCIASLIITLMTLQVFGEPKKKKGDVIPNDYLIILHEDADQDSIEAKHDLGNGKRKFRYQRALKGFSATLEAKQLERIKNDPDVKWVEPDSIVTADQSESALSWGLDRIDQRALPVDGFYNFNYQGSGVTAYIIDTGILFDHTDFAGRASFGFDSMGGNGVDCNGHGTHVAGTVGGARYGVAKGSALVAVRVLNCQGSGTTSGVIAGVDWVIQNHTPMAVANLSLGGGASISLDTAIESLFTAGVIPVVAAGNSNADACSTSPGRAPTAITVGATDATDTRASFSNFGSCVDLFAPGVSIVSDAISSPAATATLSGTSMASPHVAGVVALYLEHNPTASPQTVTDGIFSRATQGVVRLPDSPTNLLLYSLGDTAPPPPPADTAAPQVAIAAPLAGSTVPKGKTVSIQVTATDNVGVTRVEIRVGTKLMCTKTAAPYACNWAVPKRPLTNYTLKATAYDAAGNQGVAQIGVLSSR